MGEAVRELAEMPFDERAEMDHIEALEAELTAIDPNADDRRTLSRKDRLYDDLFALRGRRIARMNEENWQRLERLVGHKLRR